MNEFKNNIKIRIYFWNILSGFVASSISVVTLAVVNRFYGSLEAGILTLAFSVSNIAMTIGKFGIRTLQVSDVNNQYSFTHYFLSRLLTFFLMIFIVLIYIVLSFYYNNYSKYKSQIILFIFLLYSIDVIEDVFLSEYQRLGRLDLGTKMFSIRWIITILFLCISCIFLDIRFSIVISTIISFIIFIMFIKVYNKRLNVLTSLKVVFSEFHNVLLLLIQSLPLFISSFAYLLINNIQKFAIDRYLTETAQASFGYIAMPVFVLPLLSSFIVQPSLVSISNSFNSYNYKAVIKSIIINISFILGMMIICETGAFLIGIPVLNIIYKTNLISYKYDLFLLLFGGSCLAIINFISVLFTIMRFQKVSMYLYLFSSIISTITAFYFTKKWGIRGSSFSYLITMVITVILFIIYFIKSYKKYITIN